MIVKKRPAWSDAYLSVVEALRHAAIAMGGDSPVLINSEDLETEAAETLFAGVNGPGGSRGFGNRGVDGALRQCNTQRDRQICFLGLCVWNAMFCD